MPTLLVIDDEESILHFFRRAFPGPETHPGDGAHRRPRALERMTLDRPDVVILDVDLPDQSGLEVFRANPPGRPQGPRHLHHRARDHATAIEAMSLGAYEYLLKPLELDSLRELVARAFEVSRLMRVPAVVAEGGRLRMPRTCSSAAARPCRRFTRRSAGSRPRT